MLEHAPVDPELLSHNAIQLLSELVAIDSVNPGLAPGARGEAAIVEHLRLRFAHRGWRTLVVPALGVPDRPSLLAWPGGMSAAARPVVLNGHLDTVGVDGMVAPFVPRIEGTRMYGRGTCDMLGGVAALVVAAEAAGDADAEVLLALVADEEDRSLGTEAVLDALPRLGIHPSVCLVGEPTWLGRCRSLRGYAVADVTITGRAAHTSLAHEGVNALTQAAALVGAIEGRAHGIRERGGELLVSVMHSGRAPFTVPDEARLTVERRTVPGEDPGVLLDDIDAALHAVRATAGQVRAEIALTINRPAWELDAEGPAADFADRLDAALDAETNAPATSFEAPYWMEAALWQAAGIPSLVCGPAGGGLHAVDEWVDLDHVRAYAVALARVLGAAAA